MAEPVVQPTLPGGLPQSYTDAMAAISLAETTTLGGLAAGLGYYEQESGEAENSQRAKEPGVYRSIANRMEAAGGLHSGANAHAKSDQYRTFSERRQSREQALLRKQAETAQKKNEVEVEDLGKRSKVIGEGEEYQRTREAQAAATAPPAAVTSAPPAATPWVQEQGGAVKINPSTSPGPAPPGYEWVRMPGGSYNLKQKGK